jgi:hypothetical protein
MDLNKYQNLARETAIYPGQNTITGLTYTILGLIGEAGEFTKNPDIAEKGDNFWYLSQTAFELGIPFNLISHINPNRLKYDSYVETVCALGNCYKKVFRDNNSFLTTKRRQELIEILQEAFYHLIRTSDNNALAMDQNIIKLSNRKANKTIQGDGDQR